MTAIIIDISKHLAGERPEVVDTQGAEATRLPEEQTVTVKREEWDACKHRSMAIDDKQRTVQCGTCGIWLDPVWCLRQLFYYYEQRVDHRIAAIAEWDQKEKDRRKREDDRRAKPRAHKIVRRAESLERAAYNEYQSKILQIRADTQRATAARLGQEIDQMGEGA